MAGPHYAKGRYICEIINQALGAAKTGTPQLAIQFKVLGTPDPKDPASYIIDPHQYERTMYKAITGKTIAYVIEDLKALGISIQSLRQLDLSTPGFVDLRGKVVYLFCNHEASQNAGDPMREKWGVARAASEFKVEALEPAKMRALDNLFGKQIKEAFGPATQLKPQPVAAMATAGDGGPEITDDEVPF